MTTRAAAALLLVLATVRVAAADARSDARAHYVAAEAHMKAGRYDEAVTDFLEGYQLAPMPLFLYNAAQAYRLKGDAANALDYYRRYLAADPHGRMAVAAEARARELQAVVDATPKPEPPPVVPEPAPPPPPPPLPPPVEAPSARPGRTLRIAGITTAAVGVAGITAGVFFGLHARSLAGEVEGEFSSAKVDDGEAASRNMILCTAIGGAAVATGVVLYVLGARSAAEAGRGRVSVAPLFVPGAAAAVVVGHF